MSNTDQSTVTLENDQWSTRDLTEAQKKNREAAALIPVTRSGAIPMNFSQMVDYAKFMSTARGAVGAHLMGNVGGCLAVMEIANQFGLPAYAVARQSYLVNGRIAFMGQFFHSIVEDYAPLEKGPNGRKLQWKFKGEGGDLQILVYATFKGASEPVEYESPILKDIKVKNSPLWTSEPKRQFIYFAVRGWQTINWSEGMMHAISEDEAAALPPSEYARDVTPLSEKPGADMIERVRAAQMQTDDADSLTGVREGFTKDHAHNETTNHKAPTAASSAMGNGDAQRSVSTDAITEGQATGDQEHSAGSEAIRGTAAKMDAENAAGADGKSETAGADTVDQEPEHEVLPTTVAEWKVYALAWINQAKADPKITADDMNKHWKSDIPLRNNCGVSGSPDVRDEVYDYFLGVRDDKPKYDAKAKPKKK
jgi:hypothetical protein